MEKKSIGKFLAALRKANGYTQEQLAVKLNVSNKTISSWENDNSAPDLTTIPILAEIFSVTCDDILRGERIDADDVQDTYSRKSSVAARRIAKQSAHAFYRKSMVSAALFLLGILLAVVGIVADVIYPVESMFILMIVLIMLGIVSYLGGLTVLIFNYHGAVYRLDADGIAQDVSSERRGVAKRMLLMSCLFSFFLLSPLFCALYHHKLLHDERFALTESARASIHTNRKKKTVFWSIFAGTALVVVIVCNILIGLAPHRYASTRYTREQLPERLYSFTLTNENGKLLTVTQDPLVEKRHNGSYGGGDLIIIVPPDIGGGSETVPNVRAPSGTYWFALAFGDAPTVSDTPVELGGGFSVVYSADAAVISYTDDSVKEVIVSLECVQTHQGTVFYAADFVRSHNEVYEDDKGIFHLYDKFMVRYIRNNIQLASVAVVCLVGGMLIILYFVKRERIAA